MGAISLTYCVKISTLRVMAKKPHNRIKIVLLENGKTSSWLSKQIKKSPTTVSRWCTNEIQPSVDTLAEIASLLNVDIRELLNPTREK